MTPLVLLAGLTILPILSLLILRANAAIAFMSLCVGSVLVSYTSSDVTPVFNGISTHTTTTSSQLVNLVLLLAPFMLTLLFTRASVKGSKQLMNALPALATGLLVTLLVTPLLSKGVQAEIHRQQGWKYLSDAQTAVILGGALFSLLFILLSHRNRHTDDKHAK